MSNRPPSAEWLAPVVEVVVRVADIHRSRVSLSDLEKLLPPESSYDDLVRAFQTQPELSAKYVLKDGYVLSRQEQDQPQSPDLLQQRLKENMAVARWLTRVLSVHPETLVAISGSTSYKTPSKFDDVDLFCVTPKDSMWLFLAKALVFTRLSRLASRSRTPICLSCVMDESYAVEMFSYDRGPLFARDSLVAEVINGEGVYLGLLGRGEWMRKYFPRLYSLRLGLRRQAAASRRTPRLSTTLVNRILFATLGRYILTKARSHNSALVRKGNFRAAFVAKTGPDHLIYESSKYAELQKIYSGLQSKGTSPGPEAGMELIERGPEAGP